MSRIEVDDLVASFGGQHIGQEAIDLATLQAQLAQSLKPFNSGARSQSPYPSPIQTSSYGFQYPTSSNAPAGYAPYGGNAYGYSIPSVENSYAQSSHPNNTPTSTTPTFVWGGPVAGSNYPSSGSRSRSASRQRSGSAASFQMSSGRTPIQMDTEWEEMQEVEEELEAASSAAETDPDVDPDYDSPHAMQHHGWQASSTYQRQPQQPTYHHQQPNHHQTPLNERISNRHRIHSSAPPASFPSARHHSHSHPHSHSHSHSHPPNHPTSQSLPPNSGFPQSQYPASTSSFASSDPFYIAALQAQAPTQRSSAFDIAPPVGFASQFASAQSSTRWNGAAGAGAV